MRWILIAGVCLAACRTVGPGDVADAYGQALAEHRLEDAYALTSSAYRARTPFAAFAAACADSAACAQRAVAATAFRGHWTARTQTLAVVDEGGQWRVEELTAAVGPTQVLDAFLSAVNRGDFNAAWTLLASPLRARYTPERLKEDFEREPLAKERLERARKASEAAPKLEAGVAAFSVGGGKAVQLVLEEGAYRVAALE
jgi:hypothetical protein